MATNKSSTNGSYRSQNNPISSSNSPPKFPYSVVVANETRIPIEFAPEIGKEDAPKVKPLGQSPNNMAIAYNHSPGKTSAPAKKVSMVEDEELGGHHEGNKFSEFIHRFRDNMVRTTTVQGGDGGGGGGRAALMRRDSFNDRVSHFINRAILKIRTTSNIGPDDHGN